MEDLRDCQTVDFGLVDPGKKYRKKINIKSDRSVTKITPSPHMNPLEEVFSVIRDEKAERHAGDNRFIVEFTPSLSYHKSFSYHRVEFVDDSVQFLYIKGATKGPNIKLSSSRIIFKTTSAEPTSHFHVIMENDSNCYDFFSWDFISEGSEIQITPMSGHLLAKCRIDVHISFHPKRIGLFYRAFPCLFKYQEPQYIEVLGFHSKTKMELNLEKYMILDERLPSYPTNFCRYVSDCAPVVSPESKPTVSVSRKFINFGSVSMVEGCDHFSTHEISLTNHADKELTVEIESTVPNVFEVRPSTARIPQNDGAIQVTIFFRPNRPEIFYSCEIHAAFLWGINLEYKIPYSITIHVIGDSFTSAGCGWGPSYSIETTRIILPGTVPFLPNYTTFQINRTGPLPLQFTLEPVDRKKTTLFVVKPTQGLIHQDFQLVVIQILPPGKVDIIYQEEWYLTINKYVKVKLEICGSVELPFLLVGNDKNINFPPTTLGSIFYLKVPVKNPTRLELEYKCLESLKPKTFSSCQEHTVMGPGEQQFVEFVFTPEQLGDIHAPMGVSVVWAPYRSPAEKILRGTTVQTETVVFLAGTAEVEKVYANPKKLSITNVLLNEWGEASFFIHNSGNSTAFIRFGIVSKYRFSKIGPWKLTPNDVTLKPNHPIEIKMCVLGVERGYNVFTIQYKLFESALFGKPASESKDLVSGDIYVCFPSLKILDIRYEGLAKSLSKRFLWDLLRINNLNSILGNLEVSSEHYSNMKLPEYQENSPTFVVEILIKNICPIPVCLTVDMRKNCPCLPKRADTISRRKLDHSCRHQDQMSACIRDNIVQPGRCTTLRITAEYEVTDNCIFSMTLHVAASHNRWKTAVRVEVERGIIAIDKSSLSFLHHKEFGCQIYTVRFNDVFLGDNSRYYQVIWLYNHSQMDCRYWAEWMYVNKKVFGLINDKAVVPAYSSRPLFILFTPCELRTYEARLALINEVGNESHIQIEGRGTVNLDWSTERMRDKMPATSQFEESGPDLKFSIDHICIRPMPTHSFDSYIFFMKNTTSNHIIQFSWQRLVIWSTLKVVVSPKSGDIYPGELFPVRMHVHTYRFPAVFNFAVECLYFRKSESEAYFERSRLVTKVASVFDTCFVLEPDKQIELAYRNPKIGAKAGVRAKNRIVTIGGSVRIFHGEFMNELIPNLNNQLRYTPKQKLNVIPASKFSHAPSSDVFDEATEALKRIMWNVMQDTAFQDLLLRKRSPVRYIDFPSKEKKNLKIPGRLMAMLVSNLLYSATVKLFGVDAYVFHDSCKAIQGKRDTPEKYLSMYNDYYENVLSMEIDQVCATASNRNMRVRRYQSRDNLAYVQRNS